MVMLEHDDTLHTRHGIERAVTVKCDVPRGRYTVLKRSRILVLTYNRAIARSARAPKSACSGESGRGELCVTYVSHW